MNDTDQAKVDDSMGEDWSDVENSADTIYPEHDPRPHNHNFTISMDGRGPHVAIRAQSAQEFNARLQELEDAGSLTMLASVYSHMKAEMALAQGLGPVSPAPAGPPAPPQGAPVPPPFGPNVSVPGAPGYAGAPAPQAPVPPQAPPAGQWSGQAQGGGQSSRGPKERPAWPQVYKIEVPFPAKEQFKQYREQYKDHFKGKIAWAGGGGYWVHGDIVQSMGAYNPVPA